MTDQPQSHDRSLWRGRELRPGQQTEIWIAEPATGRVERLLGSREVLLEAPNWLASGDSLIVNGDGRLWRVDLADGKLTGLELDGLPPVNNDHVLHPDGETIVISANDGQLYRAPLAGGPAERITDAPDTAHYLHGVSPDGLELAYVELPRGEFGVPGRLAVLPVAGGERRLVDVGAGHCDGPEYSPDGEWLLLNTESFTEQPGHAQLARVRRNGTGFERLLTSDRVDWFPHLAPVGDLGCYLSFPAGTLGHPADHHVELKVVRAGDWSRAVQHLAFFGGQGTINVNSWAPTGDRLAFVAYPLDDDPRTQGVTDRLRG
ncbi:TolB family protein [Microlunatus speluncae]|uniref:TolB family protein n=1 Tax=Microlunatus speluncae TaxID=2594267 RepID=UPI001C2DD295|nr:biopolymer transporter Tol [Microlunatus speluncae]